MQCNLLAQLAWQKSEHRIDDSGHCYKKIQFGAVNLNDSNAQRDKRDTGNCLSSHHFLKTCIKCIILLWK